MLRLGCGLKEKKRSYSALNDSADFNLSENVLTWQKKPNPKDNANNLTRSCPTTPEGPPGAPPPFQSVLIVTRAEATALKNADRDEIIFIVDGRTRCSRVLVKTRRWWGGGGGGRRLRRCYGMPMGLTAVINHVWCPMRTLGEEEGGAVASGGAPTVTLSSKASAEPPRQRKQIRERGIKVCFPSFSRSLFIMLKISASLAAAVGSSSLLLLLRHLLRLPSPHPPIDRSHYKINVTKIAHNASEKCNTISGSLSSF